jgi:benzylsuccinate CoA-transferase BbsF subunit
MGNATAYAAPHGVYACKGRDRWCTIAVLNDEQWTSLCGVLNKKEYISDDRFNTLLHRKDHERELNTLIEDWTKLRSAEDVMTILQQAGVPAGVVENPADVFTDPQLRHRELFWPIEHNEIGEFNHLGSSFRMSETPAEPRTPSPLLGEHTEYVLTKILGKSDEEFLDLLTTGVLE